MKEHFKAQIEKAMPLTQEVIDNLVAKEDYFGRAYVPGQKALTVVIQSHPGDNDYPEMLGGVASLYMARITEESLEQLATEFDYVDQASGTIVPMVRRKGEKV